MNKAVELYALLTIQSFLGARTMHQARRRGIASRSVIMHVAKQLGDDKALYMADRFHSPRPVSTSCIKCNLSPLAANTKNFKQKPEQLRRGE
eukprot:2331481-Amphidinium_carterae.2